jgi:hypothetical protein
VRATALLMVGGQSSGMVAMARVTLSSVGGCLARIPAMTAGATKSQSGYVTGNNLALQLTLDLVDLGTEGDLDNGFFTARDLFEKALPEAGGLVDVLYVGVVLFDEVEPLRAQGSGFAVDARDHVGREEEEGPVAEFLDQVKDEFRWQTELRRDCALGARVDDGSLAMSGAASGAKTRGWMFAVLAFSPM